LTENEYKATKTTLMTGRRIILNAAAPFAKNLSNYSFFMNE